MGDFVDMVMRGEAGPLSPWKGLSSDPWQASMNRVRTMMEKLLQLPEYLIPRGPWPTCSMVIVFPSFKLRPHILDLAEAFRSSQSWAMERTFGNWLMKQGFRQALPPVTKFFNSNIKCTVFSQRSSTSIGNPKAQLSKRFWAARVQLSSIVPVMRRTSASNCCSVLRYAPQSLTR